MAKTKMQMCGFCSYGGGRHDLCPGGVRNGDGKIHLCLCPEPGCNAGKRRCTECGNRDEATVGPDWRCIDSRDCQAALDAKHANDPIMQRVRAARDASRDTATPPGTPGRAAPTRSREGRARVAGGACRCGCPGTTRGGLFLPGHDAKFLSKLVADAKIGQLENARAEALQISEAFASKFEQRVGVK